jgi:hypothetical protein
MTFLALHAQKIPPSVKYAGGSDLGDEWEPGSVLESRTKYGTNSTKG